MTGSSSTMAMRRLMAIHVSWRSNIPQRGPSRSPLEHCHFFATIPRRAAPGAAHGGRIGGAQWHRGSNVTADEEGDIAMATIDSSNSRTINACVWRDLAQLAAEALAIGVVFSLLLALAVFVVARGGHGE